MRLLERVPPPQVGLTVGPVSRRVPAATRGGRIVELARAAVGVEALEPEADEVEVCRLEQRAELEQGERALARVEQ